VRHTRGEYTRVVADIAAKAAATFNTAFAAALEPGEGGFEHGYVGGIAQGN